MTLGERMKGYEFQSKTTLLKRMPVIIRLDGKAFHTFTRGLDKPFDKEFVEIMQDTMKFLCENIQGCVFGYTQSDEITLVLIDYQNLDTCALFDNEIQKIVSVSASMATLAFNKVLDDKMIEFAIFDKNTLKFNITEGEFNVNGNSKYAMWMNKRFKATFDSRAFNIPKEEVCNNLIWRQQDATRNSINSLAQSLFSHKELQGINSKDVQNKMLTERNTNWNDLPITLKRGSCAIRDENGDWIIDNEIPIFTENRDYINKRILFRED
jgi:tRNA(His) 5'-end guanylyltransferase